MQRLVRSAVFRFAPLQALLPSPSGERSTLVLKRGTCDIKLALPVSPNQQTPHLQDELYIVARGTGMLLHDGKRDSIGPGDLVFVAAGVEHRFDSFSDDFTVWRVFYGAEGGEVPACIAANGPT